MKRETNSPLVTFDNRTQHNHTQKIVINGAVWITVVTKSSFCFSDNCVVNKVNGLLLWMNDFS